MASSPDESPFKALQYAYSYAAPHLPPSVNYIIENGLKGLASLPPSVANFVPIIMGAFVAYVAMKAAYSTLRSTLRQSWFIFKWGGIAVAVAYVWAIVKGEQPMDLQNNPISSFFNGGNQNINNGGGMGGFVNQAAKMAGVNPDLFNANDPQDFATKAYNNFVPYPLRMMGQLFGGPSTNQNTKATKTRKGKREQDTQDNLQDTANVATEWLGGMLGKVGEALKDPQGDRYSESRKRKNDNR
jgi:hypothetical protein